ncbi:GNAT family N-acetyltransferase [Paenibacillus timonensis]|jgi:ribosomal protein S18 acetylase RimI-like enzyme|uniref:GNAT family N-acetyltransferase n=1 Tax=Paenibacillus timonensis TaxID=225915 RepID=A0ABW3SBV9_9BACL|nr:MULTISPECIES: GNAT family N-acetyltransferase [Paenibacillus]MCH1640829.1 GNAT family N-acetyltransferase [Paenibacillus timonensis]MDU2243114.1 GNAT family N-acetyltransferase [Paenibacillus sp.]GJM82816.1 N-acetyltransferase [Paenibacillus sp. HMSSN-139]
MNNRDIWTRLSEMRDAAALMEIDKLTWDHDNTPAEKMEWDSREQYLQSCPPGSQIVAGLGEAICGYIGFKPPTPLPSNRHVLELNIAIHPAYQRQGIGRVLMDALLEQAAGQGVRKLSLRVLASNPGAIAFYQSCGFAEQGRLVDEFWINGAYVDDILMWRKV